jgi:hypothetical protein
VRRSSDTIMPLTAEEHYYNIRYTLNGDQFNRIVTITDEALFKTEKKKLRCTKAACKL